MICLPAAGMGIQEYTNSLVMSCIYFANTYHWILKPRPASRDFIIIKHEVIAKSASGAGKFRMTNYYYIGQPAIAN